MLDEAVAIARRALRGLRERRCRLSTRPSFLDDRRAEITMLENLQLLVDRQDRGLSKSLMADGFWEMWLTEAIEATLKPGMVAVDIGANCGYFSILMADRVGPAGQVYAFEPNSKIAGLLRESASRNGFDGRLTVHGDPLWDRDGVEMELRVPEGEPKNAHLVAAAGAAVEHRLMTRRLDSFADLPAADLIKIDVEGAEEAIWRGMSGLFARKRPATIFLEFTPDRYEQPIRFLDAIRDTGYRLAELSVSHGVRHVTPEQLLTGRSEEDRMLVLKSA